MSRLFAFPIFVLAVLFFSLAMLTEEKMSELTVGGDGWKGGWLLGWSLILLFVMAMFALGGLGVFVAIYGVPLL